MALLPRLLHLDHVGDAALRASLLAMARAVGRDAYLRQQEAVIARADSRPTLPAIRCPTLVLRGREDLLIPLPMSEEMHLGIAGSRFVVVERAATCRRWSRPKP